MACSYWPSPTPSRKYRITHSPTRSRCHDDWYAPYRFASDKGHDIGCWLGDHRKVRQKDCVVIDDDDLGLRERYGFHALPHIRPIANVGFSRDDLVRALKVLPTEPDSPEMRKPPAASP